ncbi:EndoU domain-containing protein [Bacillus sp. S10(2024)]|uniref:EndoU domain-containing protein n=1 Tax=Bacillus sp. S10(2024) TaxID=3162886 RepID=UPI003D20A2F4
MASADTNGLNLRSSFNSTAFEAEEKLSTYQFARGESNSTKLDTSKEVESTLIHSVEEQPLNYASKGDFTFDPKTNTINKFKSGGHGQENIDFLKQHGIQYNIEHTYGNGIRIGNVPDHKSKPKRTGTGQAWFPESWTRNDIKEAGEYVANLQENINVKDGNMIFGEYKGVRVGVIKTNGKIVTVFPDGTKQL